MQLRLSLVAATLITAINANAQDYVSVQYMQYDESDSRTSVSAPSIMINKDIGTDYTLNVSLVADAVSGASQTYYDAASGASAFSRGKSVLAEDVKYGNVDYDENRIAGNILFTSRFDNRDELTVGIARSNESDFYSSEASAEYMHWLSDSKNNSISFGLSYQVNEILDRCPAGTEGSCDASSGASEARDATAINAQLSYYQVLDANSYLRATVFASNDDGFLTNPYLNVVRNYNGTTADITQEARPDTKMAYGASIKYANALTDRMTLHTGYRYYQDDWDINSHTLDTDLYYQISSKWLVKLGIRAYMQSEANFYSDKIDHFTNEAYASSDERLSDFTAITYKSMIDYKVSDSVSVNLGANFYDQSTSLSATYFTGGFRYNF